MEADVEANVLEDHEAVRTFVLPAYADMRMEADSAEANMLEDHQTVPAFALSPDRQCSCNPFGEVEDLWFGE